MVLKLLFVSAISLIGLVLSASSDGIPYSLVRDPNGGERMNGQAPIAELPDAACEGPTRRVVSIKGSVDSDIYDQSFFHWNVYLNLDSIPRYSTLADARRTR